MNACISRKERKEHKDLCDLCDLCGKNIRFNGEAEV